MFFEKLERTEKFLKAAFCGILAIVVCWHGAHYKDPVTTGATPALMCFVAAAALLFLALAILLTNPAPVREEDPSESTGSTAGSFT